MATPYVLCGIQASGKTTWARQLEAEHAAIRLTADEWLHEFHPGIVGDELDALRDPVERIQWALAVRLLAMGCDVILDWGLWTRDERDRYREEAQALDARVELCVLDPPLEELLERLRERDRQAPPGTFHITDETLLTADSLFQRPTPDELARFDAVQRR